MFRPGGVPPGLMPVKHFETVEAGQADTASTPAGVLQTSFKADITRRLKFIETINLTLTSQQAGRYSHHAVSTLEFEIKRHLDLNVSFVWDYLQNPQTESSGVIPGHSDFRLNVGIGVKFYPVPERYTADLPNGQHLDRVTGLDLKRSQRMDFDPWFPLHGHNLPAVGGVLAGNVLLFLVFKIGKLMTKLVLCLLAVACLAGAYWWVTHIGI
jgi:hypothetical protein